MSTLVAVGVGVGDGALDGTDALADGFVGPSVPVGRTSRKITMAMSTTASTDTIATNGQVHGLRRRTGVSAAATPGVATAAPAGSSRVAALVSAAEKAAIGSWPATPGTAAIAPATSPRRRAWAARARCPVDAG